MIIHEIIYYIGLVLLLGGFIANIVFLYLIKKYEKKYTSLIDILKKNWIQLGSSTLAFTVGLVLLNVAFYIDPYTSTFLEEANIVIKNQLSNKWKKKETQQQLI